MQPINELSPVGQKPPALGALTRPVAYSSSVHPQNLRGQPQPPHQVRPVHAKPQQTLPPRTKPLQVQSAPPQPLQKQSNQNPPKQVKPRGAQAVTSAAPGQEPKLLDQVSEALRTMHYSIRTEKSYKVLAKSTYRMHSVANIPKPARSSSGNTFSHQQSSRRIGKLDSRNGTIQANALCSVLLEETPWQPAASEIPLTQIMSQTTRHAVRVWIPYDELELQNGVKAAGGKWNQQQKVWELPYRDVLELGLSEYLME